MADLTAWISLPSKLKRASKRPELTTESKACWRRNGQIAEALQQLSSLGRFRLSGLVAYLSDALIDEIVGQIEAAQGVLAKLMKDRQQQIDAYVRKLVDLLRVLDRNGLVKLGLEIQADTATEGNDLVQKLAMHMIVVGTRLN